MSTTTNRKRTRRNISDFSDDDEYVESDADSSSDSSSDRDEEDADADADSDFEMEDGADALPPQEEEEEEFPHEMEEEEEKEEKQAALAARKAIRKFIKNKKRRIAKATDLRHLQFSAAMRSEPVIGNIVDFMGSDDLQSIDSLRTSCSAAYQFFESRDNELVNRIKELCDLDKLHRINRASDVNSDVHTMPDNLDAIIAMLTEAANNMDGHNQRTTHASHSIRMEKRVYDLIITHFRNWLVGHFNSKDSRLMGDVWGALFRWSRQYVCQLEILNTLVVECPDGPLPENSYATDPAIHKQHGRLYSEYAPRISNRNGYFAAFIDHAGFYKVLKVAGTLPQQRRWRALKELTQQYNISSNASAALYRVPTIFQEASTLDNSELDEMQRVIPQSSDCRALGRAPTIVIQLERLSKSLPRTESMTYMMYKPFFHGRAIKMWGHPGRLLLESYNRVIDFKRLYSHKQIERQQQRIDQFFTDMFVESDRYMDMYGNFPMEKIKWLKDTNNNFVFHAIQLSITLSLVPPESYHTIGESMAWRICENIGCNRMGRLIAANYVEHSPFAKDDRVQPSEFSNSFYCITRLMRIQWLKLALLLDLRNLFRMIVNRQVTAAHKAIDMCKRVRATAARNSNDFDSQQLRFMMESMIMEARKPTAIHDIQNDETTYNRLEKSTDVRHQPLPEYHLVVAREKLMNEPLEFGYEITLRTLGLDQQNQDSLKDFLQEQKDKTFNVHRHKQQQQQQQQQNGEAENATDDDAAELDEIINLYGYPQAFSFAAAASDSKHRGATTSARINGDSDNDDIVDVLNRPLVGSVLSRTRRFNSLLLQAWPFVDMRYRDIDQLQLEVSYEKTAPYMLQRTEMFSRFRYPIVCPRAGADSLFVHAVSMQSYNILDAMQRAEFWEMPFITANIARDGTCEEGRLSGESLYNDTFNLGRPSADVALAMLCSPTSEAVTRRHVVNAFESVYPVLEHLYDLMGNGQPFSYEAYQSKSPGCARVIRSLLLYSRMTHSWLDSEEAWNMKELEKALKYKFTAEDYADALRNVRIPMPGLQDVMPFDSLHRSTMVLAARQSDQRLLSKLFLSMLENVLYTRDFYDELKRASNQGFFQEFVAGHFNLETQEVHQW